MREAACSSSDRNVSGKSIFDGADDETAGEANQTCAAQGGCNQNPQRYTSIPGDGTVTLHARR